MSIIAFEGIDACGKQTQVTLLREYLERGSEVSVFSFPNYETITGKKIKELLKAPERDPLVLQALMTANRYECQIDIEVARMSGFVIFDRYWLSGLVYGSGDGLDRQWLVDIHSRLIQPHHWFILDVTVEESFKRRPVREDAYEADVDRLNAARAEYISFAGRHPCASFINAMQDEELVFDDILQAIGL